MEEGEGGIPGGEVEESAGGGEEGKARGGVGRIAGGGKGAGCRQQVVEVHQEK